MLRIGVTGSFGAGKTTVARMFKELGARVIEADALVHDLFRNDGPCRRAVVKAFGPGIITRGRVIDRAKLGRIVFDDPAALRTLEAIVHPRLRRIIEKEMGSSPRRMVVLDAALLIEAGWHELMDIVIVVKARRDVQFKRIMARTGLSRTDVLKRIRRQMPLGEKERYAAYMIDNSGPAAATRKHVERVFRSLQHYPIQQESVS